jgi:hypothetical protein
VSEGYWRSAARRLIHEVDASLPKDATINDRRAALRKVAGGFHAGCSWPSQVWQHECRKYLASYGTGVEPPPAKLLSAMEAGDIIFPFRGEEQ